MSLERPELSPTEWRETFAGICDRHRGRLVRWLTAIFGARDAEDIAQETLMRLCERPDLIDPRRDAWPWLAVVSRNVGRDLARHNARSTPVDAAAFADRADPGVVADEVVAREDAELLAQAMRCLTPRERTVIRMRDFEGASIADIAEMVDSNENAVRQQLYRARRRLASFYLDAGGERQTGLVALLGLRLRELARRVNPYADRAGGASLAAIAAVLPGVVAAVAGALVAITPGWGGAHDGSATRLAAASRWNAADPRDGAPRGPGLTTRTSAGTGAPARPDPPQRIATIDRRVGRASVKANVDNTLLWTHGGRHSEHAVYVYLPVFGRVGTEGYIERQEGEGPVCRTHIVPCG